MRITWEEAIARGLATQADCPAQEKPQRSKKREREGEEQAELIKEFARLYPQFAHLLIHIPNGGSRKNRFEGYRLKIQGARAGVSDLLLTVARGGHFGLWIEFKAAPPFDAAVSASQMKWIEAMREQNYAAHVARGVAEALTILNAYLAQAPTIPA